MSFLVFAHDTATTNPHTVVNMLIHLYAVHTWTPSKSDAEAPRPNGINGHARADQRVRDAEEFELEGLMSDDDEDPDSPGGKERQPLDARQ